jgi:hypothetical protein
MEGTHIHGKYAIRDYWTHRWSAIDPHVEPLKIARTADASDMLQVVKNLEGQTLSGETVNMPRRAERSK